MTITEIVQRIRELIPYPNLHVKSLLENLDTYKEPLIRTGLLGMLLQETADQVLRDPPPSHVSDPALTPHPVAARAESVHGDVRYELVPHAKGYYWRDDASRVFTEPFATIENALVWARGLGWKITWQGPDCDATGQPLTAPPSSTSPGPTLCQSKRD